MRRRRSTSPIATCCAAFDAFLGAAARDRPIILAGHSQGALHLSRLLADRQGALQGRLVAAYVVGWPLSRHRRPARDGPARLPQPDQAGCVLVWQSFAEPANPSLVTKAWIGTRGLTGGERERDDMLCINPLTGTQGRHAPTRAPTRHTGPRRRPRPRRRSSRGRVGARCDEGLPDDRRRRSRPSAPTCCRAIITTSTTMPCSGARSAPTRSGGWRPGGRDDHTSAAEFAAALPRRREARRARRRHQDDRPRDVRRRLELSPRPAETIRRTKFTADLEALRRLHRQARHRRAGRRPAAQPRRQRSARAPSRSAPSPATSRRSACRSCCGTSAGRPSRSSGR